jgi:hypothetical protein
MSDQNPDETAERATGLKHVLNTVLPATKLAPWVTTGSSRVILGLALMDTVADLGEELERRMWLTEQEKRAQPNGKTLEMGKTANGSWKLDYDEKGSEEATPPAADPPPQVEGAPEPPEFEVTERRGAVSLVSFFNRSFATNIRNGMPSEKGLRTRQAIALAIAQKTGVAVEPKPRSRWEKLTGKGKDRSQVSGVD